MQPGSEQPSLVNINELTREHLRASILIDSITFLLQRRAKNEVLYDYINPFISRHAQHIMREEYLMSRFHDSGIDSHKKSHQLQIDKLGYIITLIERNNDYYELISAWADFSNTFHEHFAVFDEPLFKQICG